jgi:hypothetical protein
MAQTPPTVFRGRLCIGSGMVESSIMVNVFFAASRRTAGLKDLRRGQ